MQNRRFRVGVVLAHVGDQVQWRERVKKVEEAGYDVVQVSDHLTPAGSYRGRISPLAAVVSAAEICGIEVGTMVLNAGFYRPALLARDVADVDLLSGGRFEVGIGTGFVAEEFALAGLPFPSGRERIAHLEQVVGAIDEVFAAGGGKRPSLLMAGDGPRMLGVAARTADVVALSLASVARPDIDPTRLLAQKVEIVRQAAGERFAELALHLLIPAISFSGKEEDLLTVKERTGRPWDEIRQLPNVLVGSPRTIADKLMAYREEHNISYISVLEPHLEMFAEVIPHLS